MGKLRHCLLACLFYTFVAGAFAQTVLTPIRDTVTNSDGSLFNGTIAVTWNGPLPPGQTSAQLSATARVFNGALSILLVPNTTGTNYQAVYLSSDGKTTWTETWLVPVSAMPLTLSQIRVAGSTSGGPAYATLPISIADVTDLSSDLDNINSSLAGLSTSVSGNSATVSSLSSTVAANSASISSLNGTVGTLNTSVTNLNSSVTGLTSTVNSLSATVAKNSFVFVDAERPAGTPNGVTATFTLANSPSPATSLSLYRNGILQTQGVDYTLSASSITFLGVSIPQTGDLLQAYYRMPGSGSSYSFADAEKPSGPINGSNVGFTLAHAPNPAASLRLYKNGILLLQNTDYILTGSTVVFMSTKITPQTGDLLSAYYRY